MVLKERNLLVNIGKQQYLRNQRKIHRLLRFYSESFLFSFRVEESSTNDQDDRSKDENPVRTYADTVKLPEHD